MKILTIGFTKKSAQQFFDLLRINGVQRVIDIRLRPDGQLAGFAKQQDLAYFLRVLVDCDYRHMPLLAPTEEILSTYRAGHDWERYVARFEALMDERRIPQVLDQHVFLERTCCLLCSEPTSDRCHRRLTAERLARYWPDVAVVHL